MNPTEAYEAAKLKAQNLITEILRGATVREDKFTEAIDKWSNAAALLPIEKCEQELPKVLKTLKLLKMLKILPKTKS